VQETLLGIPTKRHTWRQNDAILPWVYAIARFKLTDAFRRRGRRIEIEITEIVETVAAPQAEQAHGHEIERALGTLPIGWSISETAEKLSMTEAAVRVALHRGLAALYRRFGRH